MFNLLAQITSPSSQPIKNPPVADIYLFFVLLLFAIMVVEVVFIVKISLKLRKAKTVKIAGFFPPAIAMLFPLSTVKGIIVTEIVIVAVLYIVLRVLYSKLNKLEKNK